MSGEILSCPNEGRGDYWRLVCRDKLAAKYPTMHRTVCTTKTSLAQDVTSAEVEKPCFR